MRKRLLSRVAPPLQLSRLFVVPILLSFILIFLTEACAPHFHVVPRKPGWTETGMATWYGAKFHGRATSSGEIYDMYKLTAAHPSLPFGTIVRVTNLSNNKSTVVRINDRGPSQRGRIIDVSYAAAKDLDMIEKGVVKVDVLVVKAP
jgi:rare lipoprotein A